MTLSTSAAQAVFVRRTFLAANERRVNFRQIDNDAIEAVTSDEASEVTPMMSKIYLRLIHAPLALWERPGVLRFAGEVREGRAVGAWEQLVGLFGVAPATARKALVWMHERGVIGYFAGRNGAGIRVFINRAARSIRTAPPAVKNLPGAGNSTGDARTSSAESGFKEICSEEVLDSDDPGAPSPARGVLGQSEVKLDGTGPAPGRPKPTATVDPGAELGWVLAAWRKEISTLISTLLDRDLARTREWLERAGLPKATRVAQRETYDLLRAQGLIAARGRDQGRVGENYAGDDAPPLFTHEESIRLYADYAKDVLGVSLSDFLGGYVARGEMTEGEAQEVLNDAHRLGLCREQREEGEADPLHRLSPRR